MTKNFRIKTTHLYRCGAEYQVGVTYSGSDKTDKQFVALEWAESYVFELPVRRALNGLVGDDGAGGHICGCVVDLSSQC
jgi:hypothetical protein